MGQKGMTFFGVERKQVKAKPARKLSLRQRLQEIVAEVMGLNAEDVTESYEIKAETDLMPDGQLELVEIAVAIEEEYELGEVFRCDNEHVFENFGKLLEFVKSHTS
jgi:hypothetical protein